MNFSEAQAECAYRAGCITECIPLLEATAYRGQAIDRNIFSIVEAHWARIERLIMLCQSMWRLHPVVEHREEHEELPQLLLKARVSADHLYREQLKEAESRVVNV